MGGLDGQQLECITIALSSYSGTSIMFVYGDSYMMQFVKHVNYQYIS